MRVIRLLVRPALMSAVVVIAGGALIGRLPSTSWLVEVVASLRWHVALGALIALVAAAAVRARVATVVMSAALLLSGSALLASVTGSPAAAPVGSRELRVGHINLQERPLDLGSVLREVRAHGTDVFVVLGVRGRDVARLPDRAGRYRVERSESGEYAAVITDTSAVRRTGPLTNPLPGSSVAFDVFVGRPAIRVSLLAVHSTWPVTPGRTEARNDRLRGVARWFERAVDPHVAFGDFNATPWSAAFGRMMRDADLTNSLDGFGRQPSWPARLGIWGIPIDHLVHGDDVVAVDRSTGRTFGSQHRSLWVTLSVGPGR